MWLPQRRPAKNQYVDFRRVFNIDSIPNTVSLHISVDSDYELYVNGTPAGWNQFPNMPRRKTFNTHHVGPLLRPGRNCIAVRAYYCGETFLTYAPGKPGLILALEQGRNSPLVTDDRWRCRPTRSYRSGPMPKVTIQLAYTAQYDARREDDWLDPAYDDGAWRHAAELAPPVAEHWQSLMARALPQLTLGTPRTTQIVAVGHCRRTRQYASPALSIQHDELVTLPWQTLTIDPTADPGHGSAQLGPDTPSLTFRRPPPGRGLFILFDLQQQEAGLLQLDVDAPAGTVLDIAHGEHLDDLRVRAAVGGRNFADRYICRAGRQTWTFPFRRLAGRYLQVHIPRLTRPVTFRQLTLQPTDYPFKPLGTFHCSDDQLNRIWEVSGRTLQLCAHEHYEDCPWREQVLYGFDSRLQALFGYYAFGETQLPAVCWDLLGSTLRRDGLLGIGAPSDRPITIPSFSLHWIIAVYELFLYSGSSDLVRAQFDRVCIILDAALRRIHRNGLIPNSQGKDHWHFYEWTTGLAGEYPQGKTSQTSKRFDAVYNLLLIEALRGAASLAKQLKAPQAGTYLRAATTIQKAFHSGFWDHTRNAYASFRTGKKLTSQAQLTQALALLCRATPDASHKRRLQHALIHDQTLIPAEISSLAFLYQALLAAPSKDITWVLNDVRRVFGHMLRAGATSFWEALDGPNAFQYAGSLCHGWSAVFPFIAGAHLLGVRPIQPGFRQFIVEPLAGNLAHAQGQVPTPEGPIKVTWRRHGDQLMLRVRHPKNLEMKIPPAIQKKVKLI